jgi:predicted transcriptional regulator
MDEEEDGSGVSRNDALRMSSDIVGAFVSRNAVSVNDLQNLIGEVFKSVDALRRGAAAPAPAPPRPKPAVPITRSVQHDYIVCLEDGQRLKMLKRYLRSRFDLSPEEYRRRWGLPADYPMVAPAYAERRSAFAKKIGLGKGVRRKS